MNDDARSESRYASRKWLFCLLLVAVAVGMELVGKLSPTLANFLQWLAGIYCGFNVVQKGAEWVANRVEKRSEL